MGQGTQTKPGLAVNVLLLAVAYYASARLGLLTTLIPDGRWAPVALQSGVGLAALVLGGLRLWPGVFLGALAVASTHPRLPLPLFPVIAAGHTAGLALAAWSLGRLPGFRKDLGSLQDAVLWLAAALASTFVIATVSVFVVYQLHVERVGTIGVVLWMSNGLGALLAGSPLLIWSTLGLRLQLSARRVAEAALLFGAAGLGTWIAFGGFDLVPNGFPSLFVCTPWLIIIALRFGLPGATAVSLLVTSIALFATARGMGPLAQMDVLARLGTLQAFAGVSSATALVVAAVGAERARAAAELSRSASRYRALIEGIPDLLFRFSAAGRYLDVFARYPEELFKPMDAYPGRHLRDFLPSPVVAAYEEAIARALRTGTIASFGCRLDKHNGLRDYEIDVCPSGPAEVIALARDVTDTRKLQSQLLVSDRLAAVGTLAAGVAHEINNPLAFMSANLQLLESQLASSPAGGLEKLRPEFLEMVRESAGGAVRIQRIVRDLRVFSYEGEGSGVIDLRRLLDNCTAVAANEIRHRARLVKDYAEVPALRGSQARLSQVFLNLITNAAQAIPEGAAEKNEIRITLRPDGAAGVAVQVRDSGAGIPAEHLQRIFDPFFTTRPVGVGAGLGLAVCHQIVEASGGTIEVESALGAGTLFTVRLPLVSSYAPATAVSDGPPTPATPALARAAPLSDRPDARPRLLVVDDEPLLCRAVARTLGGEFEVLISTSVAEALLRLERGERYQVVICDLMMPDQTGMDLYTRLGLLAPDLRERIIFVTGGAFTPLASAFLERVPNRRLDKPFDPEELRRVCREVALS